MNKNHIGYIIKSINDKLKAKADRELKKRNLTFTQSRVIGILRDCGGKTMQKDIETKLEVAHPTIVGILARMEKSGYVTTMLDENDKRNKIVCLTEKAAAIGNELEKKVLLQEVELLKGLTEEQIHTLKEALNIINKNLSNDKQLF